MMGKALTGELSCAGTGLVICCMTFVILFASLDGIALPKWSLLIKGGLLLGKTILSCKS